MRLSGEDLHHRAVLGQPQRVPLRYDVEHLTEAQSFGLLGEVETEQDQVGRDLVALVLEVVLGEPHRVVAEPVHRGGPVREVAVAREEVVVAVPAIDGQRPVVAGVGHRHAAVEVCVDSHRCILPPRRFARMNRASPSRLFWSGFGMPVIPNPDQNETVGAGFGTNGPTSAVMPSVPLVVNLTPRRQLGWPCWTNTPT